MSERTAQSVSVIIPVYDDYERLYPCLEALHAQVDPPKEVEIVVVDNGTPPQRMVGVEAEFDRVRQIREPDGGSYTARNAGLEVASGELLAFTDADCIPADDWLQKGARALDRNQSVGLIGGRIDLFAEDADAPTAAESWELASGFPQKHYVRDLHFAATANMWTRREVFEAVGLFDESLRSGGDREWGERVAEAGWREVYAPEVVVRHPARHSLRDLVSKTVRTTRGDFQRRELRGELDPGGRALRIVRNAAELSILPLRVGYRTARELDTPEGAVQFAAAEATVQATKKVIAIQELGRRLFDSRG